MPQTQTKIAAALTVAALGGVGAVALAGGNAASTTGSQATSTPAAPVVRTVIERRIIHRVKHVTATDDGGAASGSGAPARVPAATPPPAVQPTPATQPVSVRAQAPTPKKPVTSTSGAGSAPAANGYEQESDDRGEQEAGDD